ncbi:MAG TPA: PEGA domain-containing protein [bacterium]|jgi:hypothetical protein
MDHREEEELRHLIRKELESREQMRGAGPARMQHGSAGMPEDRRRIIEEEIEAYYLSRGGYQRVENEDGEVEWLTDDEIRERESQIPVDMEELEAGQRRVRNRLVLLVVLAFLAVTLLIILMRDRTGSIQVISNVPGATIVLNGSPTELHTNSRLDHIPVGPHLITVTKYGYVPDGPANVKVDLRAGQEEIVRFNLKPLPVDSFGRPKQN